MSTLPRHLSPRRLTVADRWARVRAIRPPGHTVAAALGLAISGLLVPAIVALQTLTPHVAIR